MKDKIIYKIRFFIGIILLSVPFNNHYLSGQELDTIHENIHAKGYVVDENTIKLRWSPANTKAWVDGKKHGYTIEKYTVIIDGLWQDSPKKEIIGQSFIPQPLNQWEELANQSDYAAVIAQAFYGEDFQLEPITNDIGSIINQANELEQRFSTSIFMAEYDYKAAELAGWAWTDMQGKPNEKYLYRVILNRPELLPGDTAAVFIGYDDKMELPKPIGLQAIFGDSSVMLSWNYVLLSNWYHSYHVERKTSDENVFRRITDLPVTILGEEMQEIFYTDSLENNETEYAYRVIGVTSFDEEGPLSDTIVGKGKKTISCVPYIYNGDFISEDKAQIYWEFECTDIDMVEKFQIERADEPEGEYETIVTDIPVDNREWTFALPFDKSYVRIYSINTDSSRHESFPFLLRQTDSIPPAVPTGLTVEIDTMGVAHLSWTMNQEPDFMGYRILRSFTSEEEKSSIISDFIQTNEYTDTLSLHLKNTKVFYSLTALDFRYNESEPCEEVAAVKPTNATPAEPVFTGYEMTENKVTLSWITDANQPDIQYTLERIAPDMPEHTQTVFSSDFTVNTFTDEFPASGSYQYKVIAESVNGKRSESPQPLHFDITIQEALNEVSGFDSYVDRTGHYIELFWRKHSKAAKYRLYRAEGDNPLTLWKETTVSQNRIVDEKVSPDTKYTYTILFITNEGRSSKTKTIIVNY